jgi:hypothetical protein
MPMGILFLQRGQTNLDNDTRYTQIQKELTELFKDLPSDQMQLVNPLIQRLAFMQITLEGMEDDIKANGSFELTKTRPRKLRERPVVKTYNAMIKNFNTAIKQLMDRLPSQKTDESEDELLAFLRK